MKSPRIAPVAALLALVLSAGGCGKDATGPNIALSLTDLASLAQELAGVMGSVNVASLRTVGGPLARTGPARLLRILRSYEQGESFKIDLLRNKKHETVTAKRKDPKQ